MCVSLPRAGARRSFGAPFTAGCAPAGPLPVPAAGEVLPLVETKVWGWSGLVFRKESSGNVSAASQEQRVWKKQT